MPPRPFLITVATAAVAAAAAIFSGIVGSTATRSGRSIIRAAASRNRWARDRMVRRRRARQMRSHTRPAAEPTRVTTVSVASRA